MRHRARSARFNRKLKHRNAMFRSLMIALVEHGRIRTTLPKAKEIRRHVERIVTKGKEASLANFRLLLSRIHHEPTVKKVISEISPRFQARPGGYTRIIKLGKRPGDMAEMAFIEWVDFDFKNAVEKIPLLKAKKSSPQAAKDTKGSSESSEKAVKGEKSAGKALPAGSEKKASSAARKLSARKKEAHRKGIRKMQAGSRAENRP
jgi:large subunit ribosomal protein L17